MANFILSSPTIATLAEAMEVRYTHSTMTTLFMRSGADQWTGPRDANKLTRTTDLLDALRDDGGSIAQTAALELARCVMADGKADASGWRPAPAAKWWTGLRDRLLADGWEFDEVTDMLIPTASGVVMIEEVSWIEAELNRRGWLTPAGQFRHGIDAFGRGAWPSANSQIRSSYEASVRLAAGLAESGGKGQVHQAFEKLRKSGTIESTEEDFGKALWNMLHTSGSHPGLGDEADSRFRVLAVTGYLRYLLSRIP